MAQTLSEKQSLPWWRRILLALVLAAMAVLIVLILAGYLIQRQLGAEIVKISRAEEPLTFRDLHFELAPGSAAEDAAPYYTEALSSIPPGELENFSRVNTFYRKNIISLPASQFPTDAREKIAQNLTDLQPALEKLDKAANCPLSQFDIGIEQGIQVYRGRLEHIKTATLLLSLRTLDLLLQGRDDDAVDSAITMLKMMRIFDPHPTMVLSATKAALVGHTCYDIYLLLERGRPSENALAKLQKALDETIAPNVLERMFLAERIFQAEIGRNLLPDNIASRFLQDKVPHLPERIQLPASRWARLRLRQKATRFFREMAQLIIYARRPWPEPVDAIMKIAPDSTEKPSELLSNAVLLVRITAETLAFVRCTTVAVAIERYHRSHGQLPSDLNDLAPAYIDSIPLDPFTGEKLLYNYDEKTYVVYSTALNRSDDGGSIVPSAGEKRPRDCGIRIRLNKPK